MKFRTKRKMFPMRAQSFLHRSRYLFFIIGTLALAYCGYVPLDAKLYQAYETRQFQEELRGLQSNTSEPVGALPLPPMEEAKPARVESLGPNDTGRSPLGRIEISTIGLSAMILEGIDQRTLRRAVGHIPGTLLPGQPGNVALAGHRDTFFRALRNVRDGDEIMLETLSGLYRYRVDSILVVDPDDTRVLDKSDDAILTLVTCYPFSFVGPAPKRFIVRAHRPAGNSGRACQGRYHGARNTMSISSQVPLSIPTPIERPAHISEWKSHFAQYCHSKCANLLMSQECTCAQPLRTQILKPLATCLSHGRKRWLGAALLLVLVPSSFAFEQYHNDHLRRISDPVR